MTLIRSGDSFGVLFEQHQLFYPQIHHIAEKTKEVFDVRQPENWKALHRFI